MTEDKRLLHISAGSEEDHEKLSQNNRSLDRDCRSGIIATLP